MLNKHLDDRFRVDNADCMDYENYCRNMLVERLAKIPAVQLKSVMPALVDLGKRPLRDVRWRYSTLTTDVYDDQFYRKGFGICDDKAGYGGMMDIVMAHNRLVLARVSPQPLTPRPPF